VATPDLLVRYDGLIDLLVEAMVREIESEAQMKTPAQAHDLAGVNLTPNDHDQSRSQDGFYHHIADTAS
jgi:hypothetical protein